MSKLYCFNYVCVCVDEGQKTWDGILSASDIFDQSFKGLVSW